jgi:hypothetical protein
MESAVPSFPVLPVLPVLPSDFSPSIHFFHIISTAIFVMWEAISDVVTAVFYGIVSVRSQA